MNLKIFLKPYSAIVFLNDYRLGLFLLLLSFLLPSVAILGLVALIATVLFAEFIKIREEYLTYGFYLYNSLLVGMGIGYFFQVSALTVFLTVILSIFTFLVSFSLNRFFSLFYMPILSLPFAFVSMLFYLASLKYTNLLSNILNRRPLFDIHLGGILITNYFKALGSIVFLPYAFAGLVIALILLFYSRIAFMLSVIGFLTGVFIHSLFIPSNYAYISIYNFNFILIAIALGGVFLIPGLKTYFISLLGVILSVFLIDAMQVFFNNYSLPVYTLPFNIIVILFLMLLYWSKYKFYNFNIKKTPEKSLAYFLSNVYRFGGNDIKIYLPFFGEWSVYQAFDGEWTHKGKWRYAYDFVIRKNGKTYANDGLFLDDYYAFAQPVIAPLNGYVVALRDDLPDNFIGNVDRINNWGNYVIIKSDYGFYVEISHLMQKSIPVKVGDYVKYGDIIGKCGNSGYSPEPHIHIQVQKYPYLGSETVPFVFVEYIKDGILRFYSLPKKDENIKALDVDKSMKMRFNFILDDEFNYDVYRDGTKIGEYSFKVNMNERGEFYLFDGKNKLYFYSVDKFFYFYDYSGGESFLKEIFKLAPRVPFVNYKLVFDDLLPIDVRYKGWKKILIEFLISFNYSFFNKKLIYQKRNMKLLSRFGEVECSFYDKGFKRIQILDKNLELRRKNEKNAFGD
jgi:urea transporter